ncbi:hypothetical protein XAC2852_860008 [Xanthomonas citri pv. citri]|nr:hypothetical protein XAC2852_860008 [Xanthomonas citri pv. citri]
MRRPGSSRSSSAPAAVARSAVRPAMNRSPAKTAVGPATPHPARSARGPGGRVIRPDARSDCFRPVRRRTGSRLFLLDLGWRARHRRSRCARIDWHDGDRLRRAGQMRGVRRRHYRVVGSRNQGLMRRWRNGLSLRNDRRGVCSSSRIGCACCRIDIGAGRPIRMRQFQRRCHRRGAGADVDIAADVVVQRAGTLLDLLLLVAQLVFGLAQRGLHVLQAALELFGLKFAFEFLLDRVPLHARTAHPQSGKSGRLGQTLGAEHHQGDDRNERQFANTYVKHRRRSGSARVAVAFGLRLTRLLGSAGVVAELAGRLVVVVHAFLEFLDRAAEILGTAGEPLGTEHQQHDHQHDQPVPNAETAHDLLAC